MATIKNVLALYIQGVWALNPSYYRKGAGVSLKLAGSLWRGRVKTAGGQWLCQGARGETRCQGSVGEAEGC